MKQKMWIGICILILTLVTSGCQVFPYVYQTPSSPAATTTRHTTTPPKTLEVSATQTPSSPEAQTTLQTPTATRTAMIDPPISATPTHENQDKDKYQSFLPFIRRQWAAKLSIQEGTPLYSVNFSDLESGCEWMGVGGQIFEHTDQEVINRVILVGGEINGEYVEFATLTGMASTYGPGGYEVQIADAPFDSQSVFWIEIYDLSGQLLSERFFFDTYASCEQNLILINFVQSAPDPASKATEPEITPSEQAYPAVTPYP